MKLKDILTKTKDYKEMEINIKKIFDENIKYFVDTYFFKFLHNFFNKEEYFLLVLLYIL